MNAMEILDSRGRPTVSATCELASGAISTASVPSGASLGTAEAKEVRDGDRRRYEGMGCLKAVKYIAGEVAEAVVGREFGTQAELDGLLCELDGTSDKSRLGANAILAVSLSFARASAKEARLPLYRYFANLGDITLRYLPRLTVNLFSGGKHAEHQVAIQDVLIVPASTHSIDESLVVATDVYRGAARLVNRKYGMRLLRADEGGLAPPARNEEELIEDALSAIEDAGFTAGVEVSLALDVAASHFAEAGSYVMGGVRLSSEELLERVVGWTVQYPIVSVEDPLAEADWDPWAEFRRQVGASVLVVGDDHLCTNPDLVRRAATADSCNAMLLKVNQVGTLTEALESLRLARSAGWMVSVSARSGETEDDWLADLVVGWSGDQVKIGSVTQSDRLAKYNRLLAIEHELGLPIRSWPGNRR